MLPNTSNAQGQPASASGQIPEWAKRQHDLLIEGMRAYDANPAAGDAEQARIDAGVHQLEGEAPAGEPEGDSESQPE